MENKTVEILLVELKESNNYNSKKLKFDKLERVYNRVKNFANECEDCKYYVDDLSELIKGIHGKMSAIERDDIRNYHKKLNEVTAHLHKEHKLVSEGQYIGMYMSLGISFGVALGLTLFDQLAIGIGIGMSIGIAIGSAMDNDAKKKGFVI